MKIRRTSTEKDFLIILGAAIRACRSRRKLTQEQLGALADVNPKYIGELERGEKNPTTIILYRLAIASETTLSELFSFQKEPS